MVSARTPVPRPMAMAAIQTAIRTTMARHQLKTHDKERVRSECIGQAELSDIAPLRSIDIVPTEAKLIIDAQVRPVDIDNVRPGIKSQPTETEPIIQDRKG